jgi:putative endonuclease
MKNTYYVYILASRRNGTLYIGVTNNLLRRVYEHKKKIVKGFTSKYKVDKLVYFEQTDDVHSALAREKKLKKYNRSWKLKMIENFNPNWNDLYYEFGGTDDLLDEAYKSDTGFPPACSRQACAGMTSVPVINVSSYKTNIHFINTIFFVSVKSPAVSL